MNNEYNETPWYLKENTMLARLERAKRTNMLAHESNLIRLEALCSIADSLERIAAGD